MKFAFSKYQGTGNDFIIIDNRSLRFDGSNVELINKLCDRRFGIGADGLMLLQSHSEHDFEMIYFNADGNQGTMSGNGGRSLVKFAFDNKIIGDKTTFWAIDGLHEAEVNNDVIKLKMNDVENYIKKDDYCFMNTGSPHVVKFVPALSNFNVYEEGKKIRHSETFKPGGTNVNFVEELSEGNLFVRTFERGVENETFSCGTGVTACALTYSLQENQKSPVSIKVLGGDLKVYFSKENNAFHNVHLEGPAKFVFSGEFDTDNL